MWQFISDWSGWIVTGGAIAGVLGYAIGLPAVLRILASLIDIVSPLLKAIVEGAVELVRWLLRWFWNTLVWPEDPKQPSARRAIGDICDDWVTILFCGLVLYGTWAIMDTRHDRTIDALAACQTEKVKLQRLDRKVKPKQEDWFRLW